MRIKDIKNPTFLKKLSNSELSELSSDIRKFLVQSVASTGGHLSSNLGVVELTVALHKVFDSPKDKLIFDVGHQSYIHKILTGRADQFTTLRKWQGLSGFQKCHESAHDPWEAGHQFLLPTHLPTLSKARDNHPNIHYRTHLPVHSYR